MGERTASGASMSTGGQVDSTATPDGGSVFLEINEAGQFLWIERKTGQPLLQAFVDPLVGRSNPEFSSGAAEPIRYGDIKQEAVELAERSRG